MALLKQTNRITTEKLVRWGRNAAAFGSVGVFFTTIFAVPLIVTDGQMQLMYGVNLLIAVVVLGTLTVMGLYYNLSKETARDAQQ